MKLIHTFALIAGLAFSASAAASDNSFYATVGASHLNTSVGNADEDTQAVVGFGYQFNDRAAIELNAPVGSFDTDLSYPAGDLIEASYRPYTLSATYSLLPNSKFQPYVGVGYTYVDIDARAQGPIAGTPLSAKNDRSFSARVGADYNFNESWFIRGDITASTQAQLIIDVAGVPTSLVDESADPVTYTLSGGFRF